jgi:hypothetical protein
MSRIEINTIEASLADRLSALADEELKLVGGSLYGWPEDIWTTGPTSPRRPEDTRTTGPTNPTPRRPLDLINLYF